MASRLIQVATALLLSTGLMQAQATVVNEQSISNPDKEWLSYGRNYKEQRFSPLDGVNRDNVDELDLAWSFKFDTARGMEATPLVHNGVIYISTGWSHVHALDARTGEQLWHYDAKVPKDHLIKTCCGAVNRGVAMWQGDAETGLQIFFGTLDGRLVALDAKTGEANWVIQTTPDNSNYSVTGAPRVVDGKVIIGNGGAELGVRGYITAYDTATGDQLWRFYTVPGDPSKPQEHPALDAAVKTWGGDEWHKLGGGGGTVWDSLVYDPELDLLYIGTGNGSPWNRELRSPGGGDNLYLSSIVALRPDTGDYVWHYQVTPKDNWDYTATQQLTLAEIEINGEQRKVIMQAPKNGFFYVLDRATGELLSVEKFARATWASHIVWKLAAPSKPNTPTTKTTAAAIYGHRPTAPTTGSPCRLAPKLALCTYPYRTYPITLAPKKALNTESTVGIQA